MVPCLQSCESLGDVSELLWWETRTGGGSCDSSCVAVMGRTPLPGWGIIWVPHGHKGSRPGKQSISPQALSHPRG